MKSIDQERAKEGMVKYFRLIEMLFPSILDSQVNRNVISIKTWIPTTRLRLMEMQTTSPT
jgi:hypothetical protein